MSKLPGVPRMNAQDRGGSGTYDPFTPLSKQEANKLLDRNGYEKIGFTDVGLSLHVIEPAALLANTDFQVAERFTTSMLDKTTAAEFFQGVAEAKEAVIESERNPVRRQIASKLMSQDFFIMMSDKIYGQMSTLLEPKNAAERRVNFIRMLNQEIERAETEHLSPRALCSGAVVGVRVHKSIMDVRRSEGTVELDTHYEMKSGAMVGRLFALVLAVAHTDGRFPVEYSLDRASIQRQKTEMTNEILEAAWPNFKYKLHLIAESRGRDPRLLKLGNLQIIKEGKLVSVKDHLTRLLGTTAEGTEQQEIIQSTLQLIQRFDGFIDEGYKSTDDLEPALKRVEETPVASNALVLIQNVDNYITAPAGISLVTSTISAVNMLKKPAEEVNTGAILDHESETEKRIRDAINLTSTTKELHGREVGLEEYISLIFDKGTLDSLLNIDSEGATETVNDLLPLLNDFVILFGLRYEPGQITLEFFREEQNSTRLLSDLVTLKRMLSPDLYADNPGLQRLTNKGGAAMSIVTTLSDWLKTARKAV